MWNPLCLSPPSSFLEVSGCWAVGTPKKRGKFSLPFRLPAPKGLIIFRVSAPKSSMSGEKCPALNYALVPLRGSLTGFLLFCESHVYIWLPSSLEQPVCPSEAVACFRWQVATILLLTEPSFQITLPMDLRTMLVSFSSFPFHSVTCSSPFSPFIFQLWPGAYWCQCENWVHRRLDLSSLV